MTNQLNPEYTFFDDPMKFYNAMLSDIEKAKQYIYLETYRFNNDSIGIKFRDALTRKSREGVKIKLLMDSWGTSLPSGFFEELQNNGGEARFFLKVKFFWDFFTKNHRRNHRKLLIIDDVITYIGSANLTDYSLNWRESILRIKSGIAQSFKKVFEEHYKLYNKYVFEKRITVRKITYEGFDIIRDIPSLTKQRIRSSFIQLIKLADIKLLLKLLISFQVFLLGKL
ncbi:MAG: hypothetical protein K8R74_08675 [Bacteroidales bacterium]|nr:hypothetical protein [Bacteroidales bacterium]